MTIKMMIKGREVELTVEEARALHEQLLGMFGVGNTQPVVIPYWLPPQSAPQPVNPQPVSPQPQWFDPWTQPIIITCESMQQTQREVLACERN